MLQRLIFIEDQCWEHESLREGINLQRFHPIVELLHKDLHVAVQAVILCEQLLLESVQQGRVQSVHRLLINNQHTSKLVVNDTPALVRSDRDIAELKGTNLLVVLVEHVIKVLLNVVKVEEYAQVAAFHLQYNLVDELINRILILILNEIAAVEDLILPLILLAEVLHEGESVLLIVRNDHGVTRFKVT